MDKPRGWILADEALREIAERLPTNAQELDAIRTLPPASFRKRGEELLALDRTGARTGASMSRMRSRRSGPTASKLALRDEADELRARANRRELKISPELLATRRDIEQLVFSRRSDRLMNGWRRAVIGERLVRDV